MFFWRNALKSGTKLSSVGPPLRGYEWQIQETDGSSCHRWHKTMSPVLGDRAGVKGKAGAHWEVLAQSAGRMGTLREGGDPALLCVWLSDGIGTTSCRRDCHNDHALLGRKRALVCDRTIIITIIVIIIMITTL